MKKIKVGITIGDMNGIGLEVILKALNNSNITKLCVPIIYGSSKIVSYHKNIVGLEKFQFQSQKSAEYAHENRVNVINCWQDTPNITLGKESEEGGKYAKISLSCAVDDLKKGIIDAVVTAPINKKAMQMANFGHPGHTEYFTKEFNTPQSLMLMVNDNLRVGLVTNHLPLKDVSKAITRELIQTKLRILEKTLKIDFGIEKPSIAILGLNPHAGDNGVIGDEEDKLLKPIIIEAKKKGRIVMGPFPADGFFGSPQYRKFDGILAMYHDQGLVPFKTISFGDGVNFTAGLPIVRTSPDHGTAFDIVGKNIANETSFRQALFLAIDVARNRNEHAENTANPLVRKSKNNLAKSSKAEALALPEKENPEMNEHQNK